MELKTKLDNIFFPYISKPGRYWGNEYNAIIKPLPQIKLRAALCFPELYESGIGNVTFEFLYHILNILPEVWAERFYAPWVDAENQMRQHEIPLFSLESKSPLNDFQFICFYLQDALSYTNVLNMLKLGAIAPKSSERNSPGSIVVGCGPALINPEPMAPFFDAIIIGESESGLSEMINILVAEDPAQKDRQKVLTKFSQTTGIYIPSLYRPVYSNFNEFQGVEKLETCAPDYIRHSPESSQAYSLKPLMPLSEFNSNSNLFSGFGYFMGLQPNKNNVDPVNRTSMPLCGASPTRKLNEEVRKHLDNGSDDIAATFFDTQLNESDWMQVKENVTFEGQTIRFTPDSLRFSIPKKSREKFTDGFKQAGYNIYPYVGCSRLRSVLNSNVHETELLALLNSILNKGWQNIRLYFMVGIPTEKSNEVSQIVNLVKKCAQIVMGYREGQLQVYVKGFSPKPHSPFQWEKQETISSLGQKLAFLQESLIGMPIQLFLQLPDITALDTALSRGDRKIGEVIEKAWAGGARFDRHKETFKNDIWRQAFEDCHISLDDYLQPISITMPLPWDHIDIGISKAHLKEEQQRAHQSQIHPHNKDMVSLGAKGISRADFERLIQPDSRLINRGFVSDTKTAVTADCPQKPISYGRKGRKRQISTTAAKRKIRIRYSKAGLMRFLSHPEITRLFERSANLANINLVYSQGLKRTPKMSFGPPLSPGIASTAEYLDMEIMIDKEPDLQNRYNQFLPEGVQILRCQVIYGKPPALASIINQSTYEVLLSNFPFLNDWVENWLKSKEVWIKRVAKDGCKEIDIRHFITNLKFSNNKLLITIETIEGRTAKVIEILESLFTPHGIDYRQFRVQRTGQFQIRDGSVFSPFDIM